MARLTILGRPKRQETEAARFLASQLGSDWAVCLNLQAGTFGRRSYQIDCLLAGPYGIVVIDFKHVDWAECYTNHDWIVPGRPPQNFHEKGHQTRYQVYDWLKKKFGEDVKDRIFVAYAVFFSKDGADIKIHDPDLEPHIIRTFDDMPKKLSGLFHSGYRSSRDLVAGVWSVTHADAALEEVFKFDSLNAPAPSVAASTKERSNSPGGRQASHVPGDRGTEARLHSRPPVPPPPPPPPPRRPSPPPPPAPAPSYGQGTRGGVNHVGVHRKDGTPFPWGQLVGWLLAIFVIVNVFSCVSKEVRQSDFWDIASSSPSPPSRRNRELRPVRQEPYSPPYAARPSFECSGDLTWEQRAICSDEGLASQDREVARLAEALSSTPQADEAQRINDRWREEWDRCGGSGSIPGCLGWVYREWVADLRGIRQRDQDEVPAKIEESGRQDELRSEPDTITTRSEAPVEVPQQENVDTPSGVNCILPSGEEVELSYEKCRDQSGVIYR